MPEMEVELGDKRVELSSFDRYKGRKGVTDCISIISSSLLRTFSHFASNKSFRCLSTPEKRACCCEGAGEPSQKFGLVLFKYATLDNGDLVDSSKCAGKVMLWIISEARYEELSALDKKWPLLDRGFAEKQHDLLIKCTEEQYQKMNFTPCPTAHWKSKEPWYKALKDKERKGRDKLKTAMGRQMTELEIMELLGVSIPQQTGGTDKAGDIDLGNILDE